MTEILDMVVIALLLIAIIYGFILNKNIALIKNSRKELANLFKSFDNTIVKAQESVESLKAASNEASNGLQKQIDRASLLIDDLSFISEKAQAVAERVERGVIANDRNEINRIDSDRIKQLRSQPKILETKTTDIVGRKDNSISKRQIALEKLLEKISDKNNYAQNNNKQNPVVTEKKISKDDNAVVNALKALGYGDKNRN